MTESANWRKQKVQLRRGTAAEWVSRNTLLLAGEVGYETDTGYMKVGDGVTRWNQLSYWAGGGVVQNDPRLTDAREWAADTISQEEAEAGSSTTRRALTAQRVFQAVAAWWAGSAAKSKLDGIASGATANATDADLRDRSTHTGSQAISTVTGLQDALDGKSATGHTHDDRYYTETEVDTLLSGKQAAGSYATLVGGLVPSDQLPSYVDDILEYSSLENFPATGETGKIYVATSTNKGYRWSGTQYIEVASSPSSTDAVPEGSSNLYYTNERASAAAPVQSVAGRSGAVVLAKSDVGLGNVDNTSDLSKPISTATQSALDAKAAAANPTITGNATFSASSGVPVTITNTGTGDSLIVNDQGGDTSPFVINASGDVSVGGAVTASGSVDISSGQVYKINGTTVLSATALGDGIIVDGGVF